MWGRSQLSLASMHTKGRNASAGSEPSSGTSILLYIHISFGSLNGKAVPNLLCIELVVMFFIDNIQPVKVGDVKSDISGTVS